MADPVRYQDLRTFHVPPGFRGRSALVVQMWWIIQASLFAWSPQFMYGWRAMLLRLFGARVGTGVLIRPSAKITYPWFLSVGDYTWIGDDTIVYNLAQVDIGSNVAIAHGVYLCTGTHDIASPGFGISARPIRIEDEVWIPNHVFVAPGVTVHKGVVVGARSNVFNDLPEGMVCLGSPCVAVRPRLPSE